MKTLLLPLAFLYYLVLSVRHKLYDWHLLPSHSFKEPVICVGNLCFGGTGKTPMTEFLVQLLSEKYRVAILSRGYGRNTKGFKWAEHDSTFETIGDEPLQYKRKFPDLMIAVDENRTEGITKMLNSNNPPEVILLDDAFQHRSIKPGFNILLTDFHNIYPDDFLFPSGNLRDIKYAANRADIIIVTKTPKILTHYQILAIEEKIKIRQNQKLFFSYLDYNNPTCINDAAQEHTFDKSHQVLLFSGIANPYPLEQHLKSKFQNITSIAFPDHHPFVRNDIKRIINNYNNILGKTKLSSQPKKMP
jgi:tetraacyldisaccharide 4''-kinase